MSYNTAADMMPDVLSCLAANEQSIRSKLAIVLEDYPDLGANGFDKARCSQWPVPLPEMAICMLWIWTHAKTSDRMNRRISSYGLKHIIEKDADTYIPNGAAIAAASALLVRVERCSRESPNAWFALQIPETDGTNRTWPLFESKPPRAEHPLDVLLRAFAKPLYARSAVTPTIRARVMERDRFRCRRCGVGPDDERLVVDHVTPVSLGGTSEMANLQTLCVPCNQGKGGRVPHEHDFRGLL